jgi:hypothetical protein
MCEGKVRFFRHLLLVMSEPSDLTQFEALSSRSYRACEMRTRSPYSNRQLYANLILAQFFELVFQLDFFLQEGVVERNDGLAMLNLKVFKQRLYE